MPEPRETPSSPQEIQPLSLELDKENFLSRLKELRDNWSNEIPKEVIHGRQENIDFKVRKNWWQGLFSNLDILVEDGMVPEQLIDEIKRFMEKFAGKTSGFSKRLTSAEDIAEADALITKF